MKTILITGSTDGIGKLTAIKLAKAGHKILLHGRRVIKLQHTISELKLVTNNDNIYGFVSDLSDFDNIFKMSTEICNKHNKIDILINNAGVYKSPIQQNKNNLDIRFAVNYFGPFLLTHQLIELLLNSKSPRIINLSSAAQSNVSFEALKGVKKLLDQHAYAQSKLALTMWSFYMARQYPKINIIAVNPGSLLNTNMVKESFGRHWDSPDKGAEILYDLAVLEKYKSSSGMYFDNDKETFSTAHSDAYNQEKIENLIANTKEILNQTNKG